MLNLYVKKYAEYRQHHYFALISKMHETKNRFYLQCQPEKLREQTCLEFYYFLI